MKIGLTILLSVGCLLAFAQTSPFNQLTIESNDENSYSFLVSGHFYGGSDNKSGYPANTLLANIDLLNSQNAEMLICLGDLFKDVKTERDKYKSSFFDKLKIPLFNAVGNHDLTETYYQDNYGATYFYFECNEDVHIILDTEIDNGDIEDAQLDLIKEVEKNVSEGSINNVFIYMHRPLWKSGNENYSNLFKGNTEGLVEPNFKEKVLPILKNMTEFSSVYCFSGSMGAAAPASFFYDKDQESGITFIATAIRALPRDAVLKVNVSNKSVDFETISLTGQTLEPLEHYGLDYWATTSGEEKFNWRLAPLYIKNTFLSRYFWYGVAWTVAGIIFFVFIRKWRLKRKAN